MMFSRYQQQKQRLISQIVFVPMIPILQMILNFFLRNNFMHFEFLKLFLSPYEIIFQFKLISMFIFFSLCVAQTGVL